MTHQGPAEHLLFLKQKGDAKPTYSWVSKNNPISLRWRPNPQEFRFFEETGFVDGVRYVQPKGSPNPQKLVDVLVGPRGRRRILSIPEDQIVRLVHVNNVLRQAVS